MNIQKYKEFSLAYEEILSNNLTYEFINSLSNDKNPYYIYQDHLLTINKKYNIINQSDEIKQKFIECLDFLLDIRLKMYEEYKQIFNDYGTDLWPNDSAIFTSKDIKNRKKQQISYFFKPINDRQNNNVEISYYNFNFTRGFDNLIFNFVDTMYFPLNRLDSYGFKNPLKPKLPMIKITDDNLEKLNKQGKYKVIRYDKAKTHQHEIIIYWSHFKMQNLIAAKCCDVYKKYINLRNTKLKEYENYCADNKIFKLLEDQKNITLNAFAKKSNYMSWVNKANKALQQENCNFYLVK